MSPGSTVSGRTPMNVVDVVAVLPFFVIVVLQSGQAIGTWHTQSWEFGTWGVIL